MSGSGSGIRIGVEVRVEVGIRMRGASGSRSGSGFEIRVRARAGDRVGVGIKTARKWLSEPLIDRYRSLSISMASSSGAYLSTIPDTWCVVTTMVNHDRNMIQVFFRVLSRERNAQRPSPRR